MAQKVMRASITVSSGHLEHHQTWLPSLVSTLCGQSVVLRPAAAYRDVIYLALSSALLLPRPSSVHNYNTH